MCGILIYMIRKKVYICNTTAVLLEDIGRKERIRKMPDIISMVTNNYFAMKYGKRKRTEVLKTYIEEEIL